LLRAFGWFVVADSLLLVALTLSKHYFGLSFGGSYDVIVNGLYCLLFASGAWYTFRVQRPRALPPDDQQVAVRLQSLGLSAREREIAQLAVEGLSNHDIAEALFISPKTVENHLYRVYQKAGVKNRVQLHLLFRS
jgi:DNA-binding CsgD family transcriptional regulator